MTLGQVSEAEKRWLLEHAAAVVYPTLYEGFGLVPFEAGLAGTPCVFAPQTSLGETLAAQATLVPWDAAASAAAVLPLLGPGPEREHHVAALQQEAQRYRWDTVAQALVERYGRVVGEPVSEAQRGPRQRLELEQQIEELERVRLAEWRRFEQVREELGPEAMGLVGPDGVLDQRDQRALLAVLNKPPLRKPLLAAARTLHKLVKRSSGT